MTVVCVDVAVLCMWMLQGSNVGTADTDFQSVMEMASVYVGVTGQ